MIKKCAVELGIIIFVSLMFFGCASMPRPEEMKAQAANYQLPRLPEEGKAIVYVVRPSTYAQSVSLHVYIDNKEPQSEVGSTMGGQYICFNLTPGTHTILSKGENWSEKNVSAKAGDIIFIQQETSMPILSEVRNKLLNLQDYEGKYYVKMIAQGKIISNSQTNISKTPIAPSSASTVSTIPSANQDILGISVGPAGGVRGVIVKTVVPGSPCAEVLEPGDTIFAVTAVGQAGSKVNMSNFQEEISKLQPGMTVKLLLDLKTIREVSCAIPTKLSHTPMSVAQSAKTDIFIGTVTGGNFAKGFGFSNINIKLEVTDDNGFKNIFFVRSDSKVFDTGGNQIEYTKAHGIKGRKISIEYFTITDGTGGDPSRSDFAYEIGQKGVRVLRLLD
jgi:hypothetical protein